MSIESRGECESFMQLDESILANTETHVSEDPVFIVGSVRSGTTMLRLMLRYHPQLLGGDEFEYPFRYIEGRQILLPAEFRIRLESDRQFHESGLAVDPRMDTRELARNFAHQLAAEDPGRQLVCVVHTRFDMIPEFFPSARYIHLVRDPRDVARSAHKMGWGGNVYGASRIWVDAERRWDDLVSMLGSNQWMELKYEAFLENIDEQLEQICSFIGVRFDRAMFDYADHESYGVPDPSLANQWKRSMPLSQIDEVEAVCGELMRARGYDLVGSQKSIPVWHRMWLTVDGRIRNICFRVRALGVRLFLAEQLSRRLSKRWHTSVRRRVNEVTAARLR